MLADKVLVALTALKRLESENDMAVRDDTRHQVVKALEAAGIEFVDSARGHGVMFLDQSRTSPPK